MPPLLKNLALSLASLVLTWLGIELLVARLALPHVPLKLHAALPDGLRVLAQSSKAGTLPRDYVALLGDSYAQGKGDWLLAADPDRNPPYHSAHVLHDLTGRDVLSFGASGAGSLRALVAEPFGHLELLARTALFSIEPPALLVFYFYEGNDLNDNVEDVGARFEPRHPLRELEDEAVFRAFLEDVVIGESALVRRARRFDLADNLFVTRAVLRVLRRGFPEEAEVASWSRREVSRALVDGREVRLPDGLQSPALDLTEKEIARGLRVLDHAFGYLRERLPDTPALVVYVPSPLASYRLVSDTVSIQVRYPDRPERHPRARVAAGSDRLCAEVRALAVRHGASFLDARPALWQGTAGERIHGPRDWKHLNRSGYTRLARAVAPWIQADGRGAAGACGSLPSWGAADAERPFRPSGNDFPTTQPASPGRTQPGHSTFRKTN